MAAPATTDPLVRVRTHDPVLGETVWIARILAWVQRGDGTWHARLAWHGWVDDDAAELKATLPAGCVEELPGQDYRMVPRETPTDVRSGRVDTGRVWRRAG